MKFEPPLPAFNPGPDDHEKTTLVHARETPTTNESDPLLGAVLEARYKILRRLGAGGMSTVYLAQNLSFDGYVAVKFIRPRITGTRDIMSRCILEAKALASIPSNFIVRAHDVRTLPNGQIYIVMEYLEGEDLGALIRRERTLPWRRAAKMVRMICAGLAAAHKRQLLHRDIKPQNCFRVTLDEDPDHIKLIDFGIAKDVTSDLEITETGLVLGTPEYMAPELMDDRRQPDMRSDLYAVGVTLYKLLTGSVPFTGRNPLEICARHANAPVIPPSQRTPSLGIPPTADLIVLKALAKDPQRRYQTALEMIQDIETALARSPTGPLPIISVEDLGLVAPIVPPAVIPLSTGLPRRPFAPAPPPTITPSPMTVRSTRVIDPLAPPDRPADARPPRITQQYTSPGSSSGPSLPIFIHEDPPPRVVARREVLAKIGVPLISALAFGLTTWAFTADEPRGPTPQPTVAATSIPPPTASSPPPRALVVTPAAPQPTAEPPVPPPSVAPVVVAATTAPLPDAIATVDPTPAPAPVPAPSKPQPEPGFDYDAAKGILREQQGYITNTCLLRHGAADRVSIQIVVRKNGEVRTVKPRVGNQWAQGCLVKFIGNMVFPTSPRGGAFIYNHPSAAILKTALPTSRRTRGAR